MKIYTIIGGINGVGKSSFTGVLKSCSTDLGIVVDADKIIAQHGGDVLKGTKWALRIMKECVKNGVSFAQETTLSGHRPKAAVMRAKDAGYYIRLYYIGLDTAEESKRRIASRVAHGGHDIDARLVERRFAGRWKALWDVLSGCNEAILFDNDNGFTEVAVYRNGDVALKGDYRPKWIEEFAGYLNHTEEYTLKQGKNRIGGDLYRYKNV